MGLLKSFATPIGWVLLLVAIGLLLVRLGRGRRSARVGWWVILAGFVVLWAASSEPVASGLVYSLEHQYAAPTPDILATVDVIAVLGCGVYPSGALRQEADLDREAYPRVYHGVQYFLGSGAKVLAFCGGADWPDEESEAEVMRTMAISLGVAEDKIVIEPTSSNTMENAANLAKILPQAEGRRIGVVTSATHMMRSVWVFKRVFPHDTIVPMPAYFTYDPSRSVRGKIAPSMGHLERTTVALHEWIGIAWYAVRY
ncbi:MAG: YdcF family protein [Solirubrobacterales bacterium]